MENRNVAMKTFLLAVVPKHIKLRENYFPWNDYILQEKKNVDNFTKNKTFIS